MLDHINQRLEELRTLEVRLQGFLNARPSGERSSTVFTVKLRSFGVFSTHLRKKWIPFRPNARSTCRTRRFLWYASHPLLRNSTKTISTNCRSKWSSDWRSWSPRFVRKSRVCAVKRVDIRRNRLHLRVQQRPAELGFVGFAGLARYFWSFRLTAENFTMELFEQHKQLYERLREAKSTLDPVVEKINKREKLLSTRLELEALRSNPNRYSDRRYSNK